MHYNPEPIDTAKVELAPEIIELIELPAKNTHDNWAKERIYNFS